MSAKASSVRRDRDDASGDPRYWFSVDGVMYAIRECGPNITVLDSNAQPMGYDRAVDILDVCIVTDAMRELP